jgi:hypothetical protein
MVSGYICQRGGRQLQAIMLCLVTRTMHLAGCCVQLQLLPSGLCHCVVHDLSLFHQAHICSHPYSRQLLLRYLSYLIVASLHASSSGTVFFARCGVALL